MFIKLVFFLFLSIDVYPFLQTRQLNRAQYKNLPTKTRNNVVQNKIIEMYNIDLIYFEY